jgi:hypothetical protein
MGEDAAQLIFDETDSEFVEEYYRRIFPAYFKGISEYMDISQMDVSCIWEMIVLKYGEICVYHMLSESQNERIEAVNIFQKIYEMKEINFENN